ncbi:Protein of unknown function [Gryllus bimaculatus]|nr:Protein of unknown function [Gryllus bimaculatus]
MTPGPPAPARARARRTAGRCCCCAPPSSSAWVSASGGAAPAHRQPAAATAARLRPRSLRPRIWSGTGRAQGCRFDESGRVCTFAIPLDPPKGALRTRVRFVKTLSDVLTVMRQLLLSQGRKVLDND